MLYKLDEITNYLKETCWLPEPAGKYEVGYVDIMTEGLPAQSDYLRLFYPTMQKHTDLPERCHIWSTHETKHGFIDFIRAQIHHWPSWAHDSGYGLMEVGKFIEKFVSWGFNPIFSIGWNFMCKNTKIPVVHQAQPIAPPSGKWPVVVFSHGMGCNRYAYSKICYDLCSEGYIVASVDHRDGSACHSKFFNHGQMEQIVHLQIEPTDCEETIRRKQILQRAQEAEGCIKLLQNLNNGIEPVNILNTEQGHSLCNFAGRLDMAKIYMMGHSFGGCTALLTASRNELIKGVICMDPWMFPVSKLKFSVNQPVLLIHNETFAHEKNIEKIQEVCSDVNAKVLDGGVHLVHTDAPLLMENDLYKSGLGMLCSRDTVEVLEENHKYIKSWIFSSLNGEVIEKTQNWGL